MSVEARAVHCPSCGGTVHEHARRCGYCAAAVATVRCGFCFHMNTEEAVHCSGCGREVGLEPIGQAGDLSCPNCKVALVAFEVGRGSLFDCGSCGGQFVQHAAFHDLVDRHDRPTTAAPPASQRLSTTEPVHYVPCPACSSLMNRKNFGASSGVIVDICKLHGTWFDLGELPRVLAFIEAGGLERERRRHAEEQAEAKRRAAVMPASHPLPSEPHAESKWASFLLHFLGH